MSARGCPSYFPQCAVGCTRLNNGNCPRFWTLSDPSDPNSTCSLSWSCSRDPSVRNAAMSCCFFIVSALYIRVMWRVHQISRLARETKTREFVSVSFDDSASGSIAHTGVRNDAPAGIRRPACIAAVSRSSWARLCILCSMTIRGLEFATNAQDIYQPRLNCPACFDFPPQEFALIVIMAHTPLALIMLAGPLVYMFWIDVHSRLHHALSFSSPEKHRSCLDIFFSRRTIIASSAVWTLGFLVATVIRFYLVRGCLKGELSEDSCRVSQWIREMYIIIICLWVLHLICFGIYWSRKVVRTVLDAEAKMLAGRSASEIIGGITLLECCRVTWRPFAHAVKLTCNHKLSSPRSEDLLHDTIIESNATEHMASSVKLFAPALLRLRSDLARVRFVQFIWCVSVVLTLAGFILLFALENTTGQELIISVNLSVNGVLRFVEMFFAVGTLVYLSC